MNRETSTRMVSGTDQSDLTSGNACWETAPAIYAKLFADFGPFDLDLTADTGRALCPRWFGPGGLEPDALAAYWRDYGTNGYSNPPYGPFVQKMLAKAKHQALTYGFTSTLLLPMRVTAAFKTQVLAGASQLWFCDSRLTFFENGAPRLNPKTGTPDPAMFDSIIVRYIGWVIQERPSVHLWEVPPHAPGQRGYVAPVSTRADRVSPAQREAVAC